MAGGIPKPPLFFVSKGLSQALSTVLLIVIGLALLAILAIFGTTYVQSQSGFNPQITITSARLVRLTSSSTALTITITNTGNQPLSSITIDIAGSGCTFSVTGSLSVGQSITRTFTCPRDLGIHQKYNVVVSAYASNVKVGDAKWVIVEA